MSDNGKNPDAANLVKLLEDVEAAVGALKQYLALVPQEKIDSHKDILAMPIDELEVSVGVSNCLIAKLGRGARVGDVLAVGRREWLRQYNFGKVKLAGLEWEMKRLGLKLRP
jgi:DNA-directed RNA polymerase alpha subunit